MFYIYFNYLLTFYISSGLCYIYDYIYNKQKLSQYKEINNIVLLNSFFYIPVIVIPYEYYFKSDIEEFNIKNNVIIFLYSLITLDLLFYTFHRIMHTNVIYKLSHKLHHKNRNTIGMDSLYLHWFDLYIGNILPLYLVILLMNSHIYLIMIWNSFIILNAVFTHSSIIHSKHNNHHLYFKYNYGLEMYMDKLLGTEY